MVFISPTATGLTGELLYATNTRHSSGRLASGHADYPIGHSEPRKVARRSTQLRHHSTTKTTVFHPYRSAIFGKHVERLTVKKCKPVLRAWHVQQREGLFRKRERNIQLRMVSPYPGRPALTYTEYMLFVHFPVIIGVYIFKKKLYCNLTISIYHFFPIILSLYTYDFFE